jgi:tetratricopeptide (TPR) repeat protein
MMTPQDVTLLNAIGMCAVRCNLPAEGIAAFDTAIALAPNDPVTHFRKGWAHVSAGDQAAGREAYERAIAIKPDYPEALAGLASIAARNGELDAAEQYARRCLALAPNEPTAISALAIVENARGEFTKSEAMLRTAISDPRINEHMRGVLLGFLGDALDGQNRIADAFSAYRRKAEEFRVLHAPRFAGLPSGPQSVDALTSEVASIARESWPAADAAQPPAREHVFLLGFLRSGTTLLEQMLLAHADVMSVEERELLDPAWQVPDPKTALERLLTLSPDAVERTRAAYWQRVRHSGADPAGKIFIDKEPLNTFHLPLIARLFPEAKILFAIRDPRDVVLSCFRRHFDVNSTTFEFLTIEGTARYYDSVMKYAETCRARIPMNVRDVRHEDLVKDLAGQIAVVCQFIGIEPTAAMLEFDKNARSRPIRSPSASQVRQPLNSSGVGRWRAYAEFLEPVLPVLQPWIEKYGYESS